MVLQSGIIVFLAFWVYQEYSYNQYLQDYLNNYVQGSGLLVVILGSVSIFVLVGVVLYSKLIRARRVLENSGRVDQGKDRDANSSKILEPHVEQQMIEMLRRTPAESSTVQPLPVLNREDAKASSSQPE